MFTKIFALDRFFSRGAGPKMTFLFSIAYDPETVNLFAGADEVLSGGVPLTSRTHLMLMGRHIRKDRLTLLSADRSRNERITITMR